MHPFPLTCVAKNISKFYNSSTQQLFCLVMHFSQKELLHKLLCCKFKKLLQQISWVSSNRKGLGEMNDAAEFLETVITSIVEDFKMVSILLLELLLRLRNVTNHFKYFQRGNSQLLTDAALQGINCNDLYNAT